MRIFNIALTFDKNISQSIINYAKEIYRILDSNFLLGTNSNPHMTIGQFSVEDEIAKKIWENYKTIQIDLPKITFAGITVLPSSSGGAWFEIPVLKSQVILRLQEDLIKTLLPFGNLNNDTGDNYRPHITVAHTISGSELTKFPFEYNPLRLKSVRTELGIGLGINFNFFTF